MAIQPFWCFSDVEYRVGIRDVVTKTGRLPTAAKKPLYGTMWSPVGALGALAPRNVTQKAAQVSDAPRVAVAL